MADEAFKLEETTIADIHQAFRHRSLTCRQLVQRYIDRIEAYDRKGPALNSIVNVNQNALAEADWLDDFLSRTGTFVGPLHGVPVVVKDQAETKGIVTTFGSIALDGYIPQHDATAVARLKEAGAIILANVNSVLVIVFSSEFFGPVEPLVAAMYTIPFFVIVIPLRYYRHRKTRIA